MRSFTKSRSCLSVNLSCWSLSCSTLLIISSVISPSLMMIVESLPTIILSAYPKSSILIKDKSSPVASAKYLAPTENAMSCISSCDLYPKEGTGILQNFKPLRCTFAARVLITFPEQFPITSNFSPELIIGLRILSICNILFISLSQINIFTPSYIHSSFL